MSDIRRQSTQSAIKFIQSDLKGIERNIDAGLRQIKDLIEACDSIDKEDLAPDFDSKIRESTLGLLNAESRYKKYGEDLQQTLAECLQRADDGEIPLDQYSNELSKRIEKVKEFHQSEEGKLQFKQNGKYRNIDSELKKLYGNTETTPNMEIPRTVEQIDDIMVTQERTELRDPVSRRPIVNPVKNRFCGHVYEKETIKEFIAKEQLAHRLLQCPYAACANKAQLKYDDLVNYDA